ncbi:MAG: hypothetical protein QM713_00855 [Arachnia sp.]
MFDTFKVLVHEAELPDLVARLRAQAQLTPVQKASVPVHPALSELLPGGGLRPGAAYQVTAGALLISLLAEPSAAGSWCSVVGMPEFGAEAARGAGIALDRLALVPHPGERWLSVVAALSEVVRVVAVRPVGMVGQADANRLAARLREHDCVLLACGPWPRAEATISLGSARWLGLEDGSGYLTGREAEVTVRSRQGMTKTARLLLPDQHGRVAASAEPVAAPGRLRAVG